MATVVLTAHLSRPRTRDRHKSRRPAARGHVKADRTKLCLNPKTHSERAVAEALNAAGITFKFAPKLLPTNRAGKRRGGICPDFYLPSYNLFIEVTQGDNFKEAFLNKKIVDAETRNNVRIVFIGKREIEMLRRGKLDIQSLIETTAALSRACEKAFVA